MKISIHEYRLSGYPHYSDRIHRSLCLEIGESTWELRWRRNWAWSAKPDDSSVHRRYFGFLELDKWSCSLTDLLALKKEAQKQLGDSNLRGWKATPGEALSLEKWRKVHQPTKFKTTEFKTIESRGAYAPFGGKAVSQSVLEVDNG